MPLHAAFAGDPGQSFQFFLPKGTINANTMKLKAEFSYNSNGYYYPSCVFHLKQTAPFVVRVTPDGDTQIPFVVGVKIFQDYLDDRKPTRILFDDNKAKAFKSDITYMKNSNLYITIDALHPLENYTLKRLPWDIKSITLDYDANGYTVVPDLSITLPESTDYAVDATQSEPGLVTVQVAEGKALPADANLQFSIDGKKIRKVEKAGWYTYGKSKHYLPANAPEILEAFPTLENACYITFQFVDKKTKIVHYGVLHGQWPEPEQ